MSPADIIVWTVVVTALVLVLCGGGPKERQ